MYEADRLKLFAVAGVKQTRPWFRASFRAVKSFESDEKRVELKAKCEAGINRD